MKHYWYGQEVAVLVGQEDGEYRKAEGRAIGQFARCIGESDTQYMYVQVEESEDLVHAVPLHRVSASWKTAAWKDRVMLWDTRVVEVKPASVQVNAEVSWRRRLYKATVRAHRIPSTGGFLYVAELQYFGGILEVLDFQVVREAVA